MTPARTGPPVSTESSLTPGAGPADRLRSLLSWAVLAPSRHNAQPWVFDIEGDEVRLYADPSRALPATDPDGRELVMACGAAMANLKIAAAHFGRATSTEILSGHRRDGLLARVRLEERCASTPEAEELFQAIPRRRTNRLPLDGRRPPEGLVAQLVRDARRKGVSVRPVEDHQRRAVAELVAEGDRRQWASARWRAELASWTRPNGTGRRDGMPGYARGMSDLAAVVHPLLVRFTNLARAEAESDRRRALGTRALLVLSTPRDGKAEWLAAGEALQRTLLRATAAGLTASYLDQPIEVADLRACLREAVGESGIPQIMVRIGYGLDVPPTPRRPVGEVLRRFEPRPRRPDALAVRGPVVPQVARATAAMHPEAALH